MTIINLKTKSIESQSHRTENWIGDGWAVVPPELEGKLMTLYPFVVLTVKDDIVTTIEDDVEARKNAPQPTPSIDPITRIQLAVAELAEASAQNNLNNKLAIAELAEIVAGGKTNG